MRKPWTVIGMITLSVGLAVGYWVGRPSRAPSVTTSVQPAPEPPPGPSPEPHSAGEAREIASGSERIGRADDEGERSDRDDRGPNLEQLEQKAAASTSETGTTARPTPGLPIVPESGGRTALPPAPIQETQAATPGAAPVAPPVPVPSAAPAPPAAPTPVPEAAKETESDAPAEDPESDRRPPTLQFLRFDPPEVQGGGTTTVTVSAVDDLSGVKLVYGTVRSPSGTASVQFSARDPGGGSAFIATISIPEQAETGEWFVANLQVVDKADNASAQTFSRATAPPGGTLRVTSEDSDSKPPDVRRVSVALGTVDAGESNRIVVDVDDDRSGVALVTGAFQSPSKAAFIPFTCAPTAGSAWEGEVPVPAHADCGEWTLRQLRVVDKANNSAYLSMDAPPLGRVGFVVSGGGTCDSEPPVVDRFFVEPAVVSNASPAIVILTVTGHDDASGVASLAGWIEGPAATNGQAPRIPFAASPDPQDPAAPMVSRVTIPQFAAQGIWRVTVAQISDKARNTRTYGRDDPALREAHFTVD
jgi:hypothetical protein